MPAIHDLDALTQCVSRRGPLAELLKPQDFAPEGMVADQLAQDFKDDLNPTQMRKVFHTFKRIERNLRGEDDVEALGDKQQAEISLLGPDLAYAAGRGLLPKEFYGLLRLCLSSDKMQTVGDFRRLTQLLSAILAYQKYYSKGKS